VSAATMPDRACPICRSATVSAGEAHGLRTSRMFALRRCAACGFAFVEEPWTHPEIYDDAYYAGQGSDPFVDYAFEFEHPARTIRGYEWRGIVRAVRHLHPAPGKWLDFGCGNGGLVRYVRDLGRDRVFGFDTGAWADKARASGLPILNEDELAQHDGTFDIVTAVEVIEHIPDPVAVLKRLRRLLKPGGLLFLTTGNLSTAPAVLGSWYYAFPEVHVSYFSPRALTLALEQSGFAPTCPGRIPGWNDIIRFKILKKLRRSKVALWQHVLPWWLLAPLADAKYGVSRHPVGRAV
jgi:SAM-dependent methyltransferase